MQRSAAITELHTRRLQAALLDAYDKLQDPNALLLVKDFVQLVCRALAACSFHVTPIEEVLASGRNRYHDLLLQNAPREVSLSLCAILWPCFCFQRPRRWQEHLFVCHATLQFLDVMSSDDLTSNMQVTTEKEQALLLESGLPIDLSTNDEREAVAPTDKRPLPFSLPFTPMVPKLLRLLKRYVDDLELMDMSCPLGCIRLGRSQTRTTI